MRETAENIVQWQSPSNIAIVKYWGKHGRQLPRNPSLSLTLDAAHTITEVMFTEKENDGKIALEFFFEGEPNPAFKSRIASFLNAIKDELTFLTMYNFRINSYNSFPHSSGIASSASAMSALVMCLCDIERTLQKSEDIDWRKASHLSRLGSGSASRSVISGAALWGTHEKIKHSSDRYAVPVSDIDPVFQSFHDDILIISEEEKSVSSTAGHQLMEGNVYAPARFQQAYDKTTELIEAMAAGDVWKFGQIAEDEALTLHALMMSSQPSYILMKPHTLTAIDQIRKFRKTHKVPVFFTLDAGPNIHLLYPHEHADQVNTLVEETLRALCHNDLIIRDRVGQGPKKLK